MGQDLWSQVLQDPDWQSLDPHTQAQLARFYAARYVAPTQGPAGVKQFIQQNQNTLISQGTPTVQAPGWLQSQLASGIGRSTPALAQSIAQKQQPYSVPANTLPDKLVQGLGFLVGEAPTLGATSLLTGGLGDGEEIAANALMRGAAEGLGPASTAAKLPLVNLLEDASMRTAPSLPQINLGGTLGRIALTKAIQGGTTLGVDTLANNAASQQANTGKVNWGDAAKQAGIMGMAGAVAGPFGVPFEASSPLVKLLAGSTAENAAFTGTQAALERRMPSLDDVITNQALMMGPHLIPAVGDAAGAVGGAFKKKPPVEPDTDLGINQAPLQLKAADPNDTSYLNSPFRMQGVDSVDDAFSKPQAHTDVPTVLTQQLQGASDATMQMLLDKAPGLDRHTAAAIYAEAQRRGAIKAAQDNLPKAPLAQDAADYSFATQGSPLSDGEFEPKAPATDHSEAEAQLQTFVQRHTPGASTDARDPVRGETDQAEPFDPMLGSKVPQGIGTAVERSPKAPLLLPERTQVNVPNGGFRDPSAALYKPFGEQPLPLTGIHDYLGFAHDLAVNLGDTDKAAQVITAVDALARRANGEQVDTRAAVSPALKLSDPTASLEKHHVDRVPEGSGKNLSAANSVLRNDREMMLWHNKLVEEITQGFRDAVSKKDIDRATAYGLAAQKMADSHTAWEYQEVQRLMPKRERPADDGMIPMDSFRRPEPVAVAEKVVAKPNNERGLKVEIGDHLPNADGNKYRRVSINDGGAMYHYDILSKSGKERAKSEAQIKREGLAMHEKMKSQGGYFDPVGIAQALGKKAVEMGAKVQDASDRLFKTSVEATKRLHPIVGEAMQKLAASHDFGRVKSQQLYDFITHGLSDEQKDLLGRYIVHKNGESVERTNEAPNNIPKMSAKDLARVQGDKQIQQAIARYRDKFVPYVEQMHRYLGVTNMRGVDGGLYMRMKALREGDTAVRGIDANGNALPAGEVKPRTGGGSVASRGRIQGTLAEKKATGMGSAYETDLKALMDNALTSDMFNFRRKQLLETMQKHGVAVPIEPGKTRPSTMKVSGQDVPTGTIEFRAPNIHTTNEETGETVEGPVRQSYYVPKDMERDYNHLTQEPDRVIPGSVRDGWQKANGMATKLQLLIPAEAAKHANRVLSLLARVPVASDQKGTLIKNLVPFFGPRLQGIRECLNAFDDEGQKVYERLAQAGGIPTRSLGHLENDTTFGKAGEVVGSLPGVKQLGHVLEMPKEAVFGKDGMDIRARVAAAKLYLKIKPNATDAELADYANQFGNYCTALQSRLVKNAKEAGFTFAGFQSQAIPTEIARMFGNHGIDASGLSASKQALLHASTLWSGTLGTAIAIALANFALSGKWPWQHAGLKTGDVRVTDNGPDGKPLNIDFGSVDPALARSMRFTGGRAFAEALRNDGGLDDKAAQFATDFGRDTTNNALGTLGPLYHRMANMSGHELYINRRGDFMRSVPQTHGFVSQAGMNLGSTAMKSNGLLDLGANMIRPNTSDIRYPKDPNASRVMRAIDSVSPVNFQTGRSDDEAEMAEYQRKLGEAKNALKAMLR